MTKTAENQAPDRAPGTSEEHGAAPKPPAEPPGR